MFYNFPLKLNSTGFLAETDYESYISQLIETLLLTDIGERVNRPTFGTNIKHLLFLPNAQELVSSSELLLRGSLQQWLGDLINVTDLNVKNEESSLIITLTYAIKKTQNIQDQQIEVKL